MNQNLNLFLTLAVRFTISTLLIPATCQVTLLKTLAGPSAGTSMVTMLVKSPFLIDGSSTR